MTVIPPVNFRVHDLDNGLKIILSKDQRVPLAHLTVHYRVGSSYEERGFSGLAHLFEHMMFQGSAQVPGNEHGRLVDHAGGRWNASTSKDRTNYYETLPSQHVELGLWLEADRMYALDISSENFQNQRSTVIEEKKQSYDNRPYGKAFLRFDDLAYDNWAYSHSIIGSTEDLENLSLEDARSFHQRFYGPSNAVLVLSGDIDEDEALRQVERYFGAIPAIEAIPSPDLSEPTKNEGRSEVIQDALAPLPAIYLGYHMPPAGSPEHFALMMLSIVLAKGESSRFYRDLVFDRNWITGLSAGPNQYRGPQVFSIFFQIQSDVASAEVVKIVEAHLDAAGSELVSAEEIEKARNQVLFQSVNSRATVSGIGELLARNTVFFDDPNRINEDFERYASVTREQILESARATFREENRTLLDIRPGTNGDQS